MKRKLICWVTVFVLLLSLSACGNTSSKDSNASCDSASPQDAPMLDLYDSEGMVSEEKNEKENVESESTSSREPEMARKMICTAQLDLETTDFDESVKQIVQLTEKLDGWFQNSSVGDRGNQYRSGEFIVRIPITHYQEYLNQAGKLCHELWRNTQQEDVSEIYYDTKGRLETQQIKLNRLQELLQNAKKMDDIITIESAISDTEWQIDSLSGKLRKFDSLVDYATIHLTLQEVYHLSNVETKPETFGQRLGNAFVSGLQNFGRQVENLAVDFAYSWIWWVLLAIAVAAVVRIIRRHRGGPHITRKILLHRKKDS